MRKPKLYKGYKGGARTTKPLPELSIQCFEARHSECPGTCPVLQADGFSSRKCECPCHKETMSGAGPEGGKDAWTRDQMQKIGALVDEEIPDGWGFAVFAFPLDGKPGKLNYVAKGNPRDIVLLLRRWIDRDCKFKHE